MIEKFKDSNEKELFIQACADWFISHNKDENYTITSEHKKETNYLFSKVFDDVQDDENLQEDIVNKLFEFIEK